MNRVQFIYPSLNWRIFRLLTAWLYAAVRICVRLLVYMCERVSNRELLEYRKCIFKFVIYLPIILKFIHSPVMYVISYYSTIPSALGIIKLHFYLLFFANWGLEILSYYGFMLHLSDHWPISCPMFTCYWVLRV